MVLIIKNKFILIFYFPNAKLSFHMNIINIKEKIKNAFLLSQTQKTVIKERLIIRLNKYLAFFILIPRKQE